jgi:uncharacterized membrane protein HdeD (DUF308 family)
MTAATNDPTPHSLGEAVRHLRAKWGWILALGIVFVIAGMIALYADVMATASAVLVIGIMMVMAGIAEIIAAFSVKSWGRAALWMLLGVLYVVAGIICFTNPFAAAFILTLFLGLALVIGGVVRMFLAWQVRHAGKPWGWLAFSGLVTLVLGVIIVALWPWSSFFTLGIFLGVDLIFTGSGWISIALALKNRPAV